MENQLEALIAERDAYKQALEALHADIKQYINDPEENCCAICYHNIGKSKESIACCIEDCQKFSNANWLWRGAKEGVLL